MYERCPNPFIGQTCWHKGREEFGRVISNTTDPTSVLMDFDGEYVEVSRHLLVKSIFAEDNRVTPEKENL